MLGYSPRDIDAMTLWEFAAAVQGWNRANGATAGPPPPSDAEHAALMALYS